MKVVALEVVRAPSAARNYELRRRVNAHLLVPRHVGGSGVCMLALASGALFLSVKVTHIEKPGLSERSPRTT